MIPTLLLPAGLAALAALLLPLLLHLVRREDRRPIDFAALRWLAPRTRPRRSLRIEDRLLLALRLLLVALLALLLARPVLPEDDPTRPWIVALPAVGADPLLASAMETAGSPGPERRWLAPGFPRVAPDTPPPAGPHPVSSLLRELDMRMPPGAPLVVLVPPVLDGVDAERPRLSRPVDWRVVERDGSGPSAVAVATAPPAAPPRLVPVPTGDADADAGLRYLLAAASAWETGGIPAGERDEVRLWSGAGTPPATLLAWVEAGGAALIDHRATVPMPDEAPAPWYDAEGRPLLRLAAFGNGRLLQWTRPLRPDAFPGLLESDFPHRLRAVLQPPPPPARVLAAEHAPTVADVGPWPASMRELSPWLALLIALLFALERWIAAGRRGERRT